MKTESCSVRHGPTARKRITYTQWTHGELVAVEGVPATVCVRCGENYFEPQVANQLQKTIKVHRRTRALEVPVFQLA